MNENESGVVAVVVERVAWNDVLMLRTLFDKKSASLIGLKSQRSYCHDGAYAVMITLRSSTRSSNSPKEHVSYCLAVGGRNERD